jgi:ubiquitin-protein ligase
MEINEIREYAYKNIVNFSILSNKRIKNEIAILYCVLQGNTHFNDRFQKIINSITDEIKNNIVSINIISDENIVLDIIINEKYYFEILLKFPKEYPFRPPEVEINNNNYIKLLCNIQGKNLYKNNNNKSCLCCSTLCCKHNWGPQEYIFNIITEIFNNLKIIYLPVDDIIYKTILNKNIGYFID